MVLLWVVYLRALPGYARWLVHGTFALIGVSVLTTWQHHFIDLPTGLWLGGLCLWLWPDERPSPLASAALTPDVTRRRMALIYGLAALLAGGVAWALGGITLWLFWPAGSLALVAAAYLYLGPTVFQKRADGSMTPAALILLGPHFLGAWLKSRAWTRNQAAADAVAPGLLLGRLPGAADLDHLGIAAIVDVSAELPCPTGGRPYFSIPMLDLIPPQPEQLEQAAQAIRAALATANGPVLVCCALGYSRSALAVAAWLLASGKVDTPEAVEALIRQARPAIVLGTAQRVALEAWWTQQARPVPAP
jgi:protein-tyrosine phosphatase